MRYLFMREGSDLIPDYPYTPYNEVDRVEELIENYGDRGHVWTIGMILDEDDAPEDPD